MPTPDQTLLPTSDTAGGLDGNILAAASMIQSIRDQIPDPVDDPRDDGTAFTLATLLRWMNDGMRQMCLQANIITDWFGVPSLVGMDIYPLPPYISTVEQTWYNLIPLTRTAELDDIFTTQITARSWWFGPHSIHATPRLHVWPACDITAGTTTLTAPMTSDDTTFTINTTLSANTGPINAFGFFQVGTGAGRELILFRKYNTTTGVVSNILRGQGGTIASSHNSGDTVQDANIFFKGFRLPNPLTGVDDPIEIPQGLWPVVELYVLSKVRQAEQDAQGASQLRQEFNAAVDKLGEKSPVKGLRQGLQVRTEPPSPELYGGHVFIK